MNQLTPLPSYLRSRQRLGLRPDNIVRDGNVGADLDRADRVVVVLEPGHDVEVHLIGRVTPRSARVPISTDKEVLAEEVHDPGTVRHRTRAAVRSECDPLGLVDLLLKEDAARCWSRLDRRAHHADNGRYGLDQRRGRGDLLGRIASRCRADRVVVALIGEDYGDRGVLHRVFLEHVAELVEATRLMTSSGAVRVVEPVGPEGLDDRGR